MSPLSGTHAEPRDPREEAVKTLNEIRTHQNPAFRTWLAVEPQSATA